jgi:hypothetical protein
MIRRTHKRTSWNSGILLWRPYRMKGTIALQSCRQFKTCTCLNGRNLSVLNARMGMSIISYSSITYVVINRIFCDRSTKKVILNEIMIVPGEGKNAATECIDVVDIVTKVNDTNMEYRCPIPSCPSLTVSVTHKYIGFGNYFVSVIIFSIMYFHFIIFTLTCTL